MEYMQYSLENQKINNKLKADLDGQLFEFFVILVETKVEHTNKPKKF